MDVVAQLSSLTDEDVICVEGKPNWSPGSRAYVIRVPEFSDVPVGPITDHFLEAFIAKEVLQDWMHLLKDRKPSLNEQCEALIYYALNDGLSADHMNPGRAL